jgi:glutaredoxin 3
MIARPYFKTSTTHKDLAMSATVEIYTQWGCPYCVRAKALLDAKGAAYTEIDVTMDTARRKEMAERNPGARTVPQVFANGQALGGCDDIHALDAAGKLDALLGL